MQFHVAGLLREAVGATRHFEVTPEGQVEAGAVELVRLPGGILVRFTGAARTDTVCSRCLDPVVYRDGLEFEEIFVQLVDVVTGAKVESEVTADPEAFQIGLDHTIDITEAVRQYTEMAAAMQPLCRPECPGLCLVCGQDLAVGACTCDRTPADSRWAALADLKLFPNG